MFLFSVDKMLTSSYNFWQNDLRNYAIHISTLFRQYGYQHDHHHTRIMPKPENSSRHL